MDANTYELQKELMKIDKIEAELSVYEDDVYEFVESEEFRRIVESDIADGRIPT